MHVLILLNTLEVTQPFLFAGSRGPDPRLDPQWQRTQQSKRVLQQKEAAKTNQPKSKKHKTQNELEVEMVAGPEEAIQLSDSSPGRRPGVLVIAFF